MQNKKIYLDNKLNILEPLQEILQKLHISFNVIEINDDFLIQSDNNYSIILIEFKTILNYKDFSFHKIIINNPDSSIIIVYNSEENIDFKKFAEYRNCDFISSDNIHNIVEFIEYSKRKNTIIGNTINTYNKKIADMMCFQNFFNTINLGVITLDSSLEIKKYNKRAKELLNRNKIDALKDIFDLEDYNDFQREISSFLNDEKFDTTLNYYLKDSDNNNIPMEIILHKIIQFNATYISFIFDDITEKIKKDNELNVIIEEMQFNRDIIEQNASEQIALNSKLFEQQEELTRLNASKDKFFSIIAHDLKTPFQSLLGYSDILSRDIENMDDEEISLFASNLNHSAHKLFKLLENLLHWSRIQRGVIQYNPEEEDLYLMAELNIDLVKSRVEQKSITLKNEIAPGTTCYGDANMVNTILRNLISNSIKFTDKNGTITLKSSYDKDYVCLHVVDTGVGMTQEVMDKIFRIDQHHTTPGTNEEEGTGLGLILCHELAQKNNGELTVSSEVGKGSDFKLKIPKRKK
jgi:signal transduction histidine kinase